jgi:hypothetical protein
MKVLHLRYAAKLQHYKDRNVPWLKMYTAILGTHAITPRTDKEVVAYAQAVWALSDMAKLVLPYLEALGSRQTPINQIPYQMGWIAHELRILNLSSQPRVLSRAVHEIIDQGLAECLDITSIHESRLPLSFSEGVSLGSDLGGGAGEGPSIGDIEREAPDWAKVSPELLLAVEHYELAMRKAPSWPAVRRGVLRDLGRYFAEADGKVRDLEPEFDWLICFARATEQGMVAEIPGFGLEWFFRTESNGARLNALKVWDYGFESREEKKARQGRHGDWRDGDSDFARSNGYVVRMEPSNTAVRRFVRSDEQVSFAFADEPRTSLFVVGGRR